MTKLETAQRMIDILVEKKFKFFHSKKSKIMKDTWSYKGVELVKDKIGLCIKVITQSGFYRWIDFEKLLLDDKAMKLIYGEDYIKEKPILKMYVLKHNIPKYKYIQLEIVKNPKNKWKILQEFLPKQ